MPQTKRREKPRMNEEAKSALCLFIIAGVAALALNAMYYLL